MSSSYVKTRIKHSCVRILALLLLPQLLWAADDFVVESIRVEGLQRISISTVLNYLTIKEGESVDSERSTAALRALFKTGFFEDIKLLRDNGALIVKVKERPSIAKVKIEGNNEIPSEELEDGLKKVGLAEGRVFDRSLLEKVEQELQRQYFSLGRYGVKIESKLVEQPRNRVAVDIEVDEGEVTRIRQITLIGNAAFSDEELYSVMELGVYRDGAMFAGSSKYSKQQLQADLELIRSYYRDRGYIHFDIESTQVTITPDKRGVYITVNLFEGDKYSVSSVALSGKLIVEEEELQQLVSVNAGDVFSSKAIAESSSRIGDRLGLEGYASANVNPIPDVDEDNKTVALTFFVDPGKRVYIRRVTFNGNTKTMDHVLRREMRQLEGGWYSSAKLNRSRVRLQRTGFFDDVTINTQNVPGHTDLVDVVYNVVERPSGSVTASLGYGQGSGMILAASVNQNNFLGSGQRVSAEINNTEVNTVYSFSLTDPYHTIDGVSRGFRVFSRKTNASAADIADYNADTYGGSVTYGFPLSEFRTARVGIGGENTSLHLASTPPIAYQRFVDRHGSVYNTLTMDASWSYDSRDRVLFPDSGYQTIASSNIALPVGDLSFYKFSLRQEAYWKLATDWIIHMEGSYSQGDGYGDTTTLPFYEHYYGGGGQSVRGFRDNSLGPRDPVSRDTIGGNRRITGRGELAFPTPFSKGSRSVRFTGFVDVGNVYGEEEPLDLSRLRASHGVAFKWITPVGALTFSWAWPLRSYAGDNTQRFQFAIGAPF